MTYIDYILSLRSGPATNPEIPAIWPRSTYPAGEAEGADGGYTELEGGAISDLEITHLEGGGGGLAEGHGAGEGARGEGRSRGQHGGEEYNGGLHLHKQASSPKSRSERNLCLASFSPALCVTCKLHG